MLIPADVRRVRPLCTENIQLWSYTSCLSLYILWMCECPFSYKSNIMYELFFCILATIYHVKYFWENVVFVVHVVIVPVCCREP